LFVKRSLHGNGKSAAKISNDDMMDDHHVRNWQLMHFDVENANGTTISGLDPASKYQFHVRGYVVSKSQTGVMSNITTVTTHEDVPSQPVDVATAACCTANNNSQVTVSWREPTIGNGLITGYVVTATRLPWRLTDNMLSSVNEPFRKFGLDLDDRTNSLQTSLGYQGEYTCSRACWPASDSGNGKLVSTDHSTFLQWLLDTFREDTENCIRNGRLVNNTSTDLKGLQPFSVYTVKVSAMTSVGCGPSGESTFIQTAPSRLADLVSELSATTDTTMVTVHWRRPSSPNGGVIEQYHLSLSWVDDGRMMLSAIKMPGVRCHSSLIGDWKETAVELCNVTTSNRTITINFIIDRAPSVSMPLVVAVGVTSLYVWPDALRPIVQSNCTVPGINTAASSNDTEDSNYIMIIVLVVASVVSIAFMLVFVYLFRQKRIRRKLKRPISPGYLDIEQNRAREDFVAEMQLKDEFPPDEWEIDRGSVTVGDVLGQGIVGSVHKGILNAETGQTAVAVKSLLNGSTIEAKISFLKEASVMKSFNSEHVVRLLGIVSVNEPVLVIMELMANGDLKHYLRSLRPEV
jgi:hypothetical protein